MKVALFSLNQSLNELFIETLFSNGITVYSSENIKDYLLIVLNKEIDCLFVDIDIAGIDWLKLINYIKKKKAPRNLFMVIMTASTEVKLLNQFLLAGINAIFDKKKSLKGYIGKIQQLLKIFEMESNRNGVERRQYVRVKIHEEEDVFVNLEMAGKEHLGYFQGKATDISIVAVAFQIQNEQLHRIIERRTRKISNLQIVINKKVYFCEGEIIRYHGNLAVARFQNINNIFTMGIANYIYKKINN